MNPQQVLTFSEIALKYGPFFFSLVFIITLTRWAYTKYLKAISCDPPLSPRDQESHRLFFWTTFVVGIVLVGICVSWWWLYTPTNYTYLFEGKIKDLQSQDELDDDSYFMRKELRTQLGDQELVRNEHFLIKADHPFKKGQKFELRFSKDKGRTKTLLLSYPGDSNEHSYKIDYDANGTPFLRDVTDPDNDKTSLSSFLVPVYAAEKPRYEEERSSPDAQGSPVTFIQPLSTVQVLQAPTGNVASRLDALDYLLLQPQEALIPLLDVDGSEPFPQTIFDLTQHSDRELAIKATRLAGKMDIDGYLVRCLGSSRRESREKAEGILLRISQQHALTLLRRVSPQYPDVVACREKVQSGNFSRVLKATASPQGDRFYVKATWGADDSVAKSCLTRLFNGSLQSNRTLAQEGTLMQGKTQRYVYWYGKKWPLDIFNGIKNCGGNADYVLAY